jgi:hypothetical protein
VADQGAGDVGEGAEVVGLAFVAAVQASPSGESGHGAFDDPAVVAEPLRDPDDLAGDAVPRRRPSLSSPPAGRPPADDRRGALSRRQQQQGAPVLLSW